MKRKILLPFAFVITAAVLTISVSSFTKNQPVAENEKKARTVDRTFYWYEIDEEQKLQLILPQPNKVDQTTAMALYTGCDDTSPEYCLIGRETNGDSGQLAPTSGLDDDEVITKE